jgi:hypothetical protein
MGVNVYANGMEVSAKKSDNQSIAAMPDVCLSPPTPPAGPVPIPYPNFSQASDLSDGTRTVKLGGQEAGIKDESNYSTSKGDEAATRTLGMGTVTHTIQGKTKFAAWSMDVKFEGSNVTRFGDITTHNHMNNPNTACTTTSVAGADQDPVQDPKCEELDEKNKDERKKVVDELEDQSSLNQAEQATLDKAEGTGMTISSAISSVPGAEGTFSASSSGCAQAQNPNGLVGGGTSEQKMGCNAETRASNDPKYDDAKEKAGVLCDKSYVHPGGGAGAHAEPKIVNSMCQDFPASPMRGGSMLFSIDWRFKRENKPMQSGMPCKHCYKMMCHAATECDIQILICDKDGKPQPLSKDDCKSEDGYENLSRRVDGKPKPGR